jgi:hypothetical protein
MSVIDDSDLNGCFWVSCENRVLFRSGRRGRKFKSCLPDFDKAIHTK